VKPGFYNIRVTKPDGTTSLWQTWAVTATNAHWIAAELHPGCQVEVLGLAPEW